MFLNCKKNPGRFTRRDFSFIRYSQLRKLILLFQCFRQEELQVTAS